MIPELHYYYDSDDFPFFFFFLGERDRAKERKEKVNQCNLKWADGMPYCVI